MSHRYEMWLRQLWLIRVATMPGQTIETPMPVIIAAISLYSDCDNPSTAAFDEQ